MLSDDEQRLVLFALQGAWIHSGWEVNQFILRALRSKNAMMVTMVWSGEAHRHSVGLEWSVPQVHDGSLELSYSDNRLIIPLSVTTVT